MIRAKLLLITAACAFAVATGTPAFALNPQPLPPGYKSHINGTFTGQTTQMRKAGGEQQRH
jgi:hypothetical protein